MAFELLRGHRRRPRPRRESVALKALPEAVRHAIEQAEPQLAKIADAFKDEPITYVSARARYGWAYGLAMCFLQEMQWKHAAAFNTGEFFQGAFKMVDDDTAVLLWLGGGRLPPLAERGKRFLDAYCKKAQYVDVKDLELPGIPAALQQDVSPIVVGAPGQPARPALRGGARPRPRDPSLHVQGRLLSPTGQEETDHAQLRRRPVSPHPVGCSGPGRPHPRGSGTRPWGWSREPLLRGVRRRGHPHGAGCPAAAGAVYLPGATT